MIDHLMPDIPRLYSAIAEWMACMIFILPIQKRFSKVKTGIIMAVMLVVQSGFMVVTENVGLFFWLLCMIGAVLLMLLFIYLSCSIAVTDAVYGVLIAFVVAEFMASIEWQVVCYFGIAQSGVWWKEWLALILIYGVISTILYKILHVHFPRWADRDWLERKFVSIFDRGIRICCQQHGLSHGKYTIFWKVFI